MRKWVIFGVFMCAAVVVGVMSVNVVAETYRITISSVKNARQLKDILNNMQREIDDLESVSENSRDLANSIRSNLLGDYLLGGANLAVGSTAADVAHGEISYVINGATYTVAANAAGKNLTPTTAIAQDKYGGWKLEVGTNGTVDVIPAPLNATTPYATASAAYQAAIAVAVQADHVVLGALTAMSNSGTFTPDTTALSAGNVTDAYTNVAVGFTGIGSAVTSTYTQRVQRTD